jgi:hypothetical protein
MKYIICKIADNNGYSREDDLVSRAAGEWRNSSERVIVIVGEDGNEKTT